VFSRQVARGEGTAASRVLLLGGDIPRLAVHAGQPVAAVFPPVAEFRIGVAPPLDEQAVVAGSVIGLVAIVKTILSWRADRLERNSR
jgi:hypothetical protein